MKNPLIRTAVIGAVAALPFLSSGCSAKAKEARYLSKANSYFNAGYYDQAEIEYKNALRLERLNPVAVGRLGIIYFEQGRIELAAPFLIEGLKLQPDNADLRLKMAMFYLGAGNSKLASEAAEAVLQKRPEDPDAPLLLVEAARTREEAEAVRARLEHLPASALAGAPVTVAMGTIDLREHNLKAAEQAFKRALAIDPNSSSANAAMGNLYLSQNNLELADKSFSIASEHAPIRSARRLQYAEFKIKVGKLDEAQHLLEAISEKAPDSVQVWVLRAQIASIRKDYAAGISLIDNALSRDPSSTVATLAKARLEVAKGEAGKAIALLEAFQKLRPKSPEVLYELALAQLSAGKAQEAEGSLARAVAIAPQFSEAQLMLASVEIRKGDFGVAIVSLKQLLQLRPEVLQAQLLLADAYRKQGDFDDALSICKQLVKAYPTNPVPFMLIGALYIEANRRDDARKAFGDALAISPGYPSAIERLVELDIAERHFDAALKRAQSQIAKEPKRASSLVLLARVYIAQRDSEHAEDTLKRAIKLEPDAPAAYSLLAHLYLATNQQEKALADLADAVARNPKDTDALMLTAVIEDRKGDFKAARVNYEKLLAIEPRFVSALNNLAYLVSEHSGQTDYGLELAQRARLLLPNDPHVADTLGWILYQKHEYAWALSLLEEAAEALPTEAEVQYHLGMGQYVAGHEDSARAALQRAYQLNQEFPGRDEAKLCLSILNVDARNPSADARSFLEKTVQTRKGDPVALSRLGAIYERDGELDKALSAYESAHEASPGDAVVLERLAFLYATGNHKDIPKALEFAKTAHELEPENAAVSHTLGLVAFQKGDYTWAASLLQEALSRDPENPKLLYDLGAALYYRGRVPEALTAFRHSLQAGTSFAQAKDAREFIKLVNASANPPTAESRADVAQALAANPNSLPAQMAMASILQRTSDLEGATRSYERIIEAFPDFAPAAKQLAILGAEASADNPKILEIGLKAISAFPGDPVLERSIGILEFREGDFTKSALFLSSADAAGCSDAVCLFYLGMSYYNLKDLSRAKLALNRSVGAGLTGDMAASAKLTLSKLN